MIDVIRLTEAVANRLILNKQHLLVRLPQEQWLQALDALVGLHSARFKSPIFSLAARAEF